MRVKRSGSEIWRLAVGVKGDAYITGVVCDTTLDEIRVTAPPADKLAALAAPESS